MHHSVPSLKLHTCTRSTAQENEGPNPSTTALPGAAPTAGAAAVPGAAKPLKKILYNGQQVHGEAGPAKLRLAPAALPQGAQPHGVGLTAGANLQSQGLAPAASRPLLQVWRRVGSDEPNQECMPGCRPGLGQVLVS